MGSSGKTLGKGFVVNDVEMVVVSPRYEVADGVFRWSVTREDDSEGIVSYVGEYDDQEIAIAAAEKDADGLIRYLGREIEVVVDW